MEILSPEFLTALLAIVVIDLVLAGDNAIVIALAARNVPKHLQKRAILWGTVGAIEILMIRTAGESSHHVVDHSVSVNESAVP